MEVWSDFSGAVAGGASCSRLGRHLRCCGMPLGVRLMVWVVLGVVEVGSFGGVGGCWRDGGIEARDV